MVVTNDIESLENKVSRIQRIGHGIKTTKDYVDKKLSTVNPFILGAIVGTMKGSWIYYINCEGDDKLALLAAGKSLAWAACSTWITVGSCRKLSRKYEQPLAMLLGVGVPVAISGSAAFVYYHFFGRAPNPLESTAWTTVLTIPGFTYLSWDVIKQKRIKEQSLTDYIE